MNASTYARFAGVALPPLVVAVGWLVYRDLDRVAHEPLPSTVSTPAPVPAPAPFPTPSAPAAAASSAFRNIYDQGIWGTNELGEGTSGSGSTLASTAIYRAFLQDFLKQHGITSVVDAGCGDWEFSKSVDWRGIDYKGYDIVESVIAKDKKKYEKPNIHFFVANIVTDELPPADLLVSKHVLQHLPNADVAKFLEQLPKLRARAARRQRRCEDALGREPRHPRGRVPLSRSHETAVRAARREGPHLVGRLAHAPGGAPGEEEEVTDRARSFATPRALDRDEAPGINMGAPVWNGAVADDARKAAIETGATHVRAASIDGPRRTTRASSTPTIGSSTRSPRRGSRSTAW